MVTGAKEYVSEYQSKGRKIEVPESVKLTTKEYLEEEDTIGQFIDDCFFVEYDPKLPQSQIYRRYLRWCEDNGIKTTIE